VEVNTKLLTAMKRTRGGGLGQFQSKLFSIPDSLKYPHYDSYDKDKGGWVNFKASSVQFRIY